MNPPPNFCEKCGEPLSPSVRFCESCGSSVLESPPSGPAAQAPKVAEAKESEPLSEPAKSTSSGMMPKLLLIGVVAAVIAVVLLITGGMINMPAADEKALDKSSTNQGTSKSNDPGGSQAMATNNSPPYVYGFSYPSSNPIPGSNVSVRVSASDPDKDQIYYKFFINEQPKTDWIANPNWNWMPSSSEIGNNRFEAWIRDGNHAGPDSFDESYEWNFTVVEAPPKNNLPTLKGLNPDKNSPQVAGTTVTWTADASDPDGDQIYYKFFLNGNSQTDWTTSNTWIWYTSTADLGSNEIKVRIRDGNHAAEDSYDDFYYADAFTITEPSKPNGIPKVTALTADPKSPQESGIAITWTAIASDPDGDQIHYKFFLNGNSQTDWTTSNTWIWHASTADEGSNEIKVYIRDGNHADTANYDDYYDDYLYADAFTITEPIQSSQGILASQSISQSDMEYAQEFGGIIRDLVWLGKDADVAGKNGYPDGYYDGHFRLSMYLPNPIEIVAIRLSGSFMPGRDKEMPMWQSGVDANKNLLVVFYKGKQLNYGYVSSLGAYSGVVDFDLFAEKPEYFGPGEYVNVGVDFSNKHGAALGGEISDYIGDSVKSQLRAYSG